MAELNSILELVLSRMETQANDGISEAFYKLNKVATGNTLRGTKAVTEKERGQYSLVITGPISLDFIDEGRGAGSPPPIRSITSWLASKSLNYSAFAVAAGIGRKGIQPVPIKDEIIRNVDRNIEQVFDSGGIDSLIFNYIGSRLQ